MTTVTRHIAFYITLLFSVFSHASTTWVPINVGDITTFIPYAPSGALAIPGNAQLSSNGGVLTLTWADVEHASQYEIQALNASGQWVSILTTSELSVIIDSRFAGYTSVRVTACTYNSCSNTGGWTAGVSLTIEPTLGKNVSPAPTPTLAAVPPVNNAHNAGIGLSAGSFKVNEAGSATYNIPLSLPKGIANVSPSLSLYYNSMGGNTSLGMGWNVSGLSAISRCRQTTEQDDNIEAISLTNTDRFCLDGQKLIAVTGNYGEDDTQYRTEIDSQTRITSNGTTGNGPAYFTVERADGSISYYGNEDIDGARADSVHLSANSTAFTWFIASTSDNLKNSDNSIFFYYNTEEDGFGSNEVVIDKIEYSGNRVQFNYRDNAQRTDLSYGYMHGERVERTALLDDIAIYNHNSSTSPLQSYHLTYENDAVTGNYRINAIQECNGSLSGTCLPATTFDWYDQPEVNHFNFDKNIDLGSGELKASVPFDLDGDGFNDLVYVIKSQGNYKLYVSYNNKGTFSAPNKLDTFSLLDDETPTIIPMDIDGDSNMEIIYYRAYTGKNEWVSYDLSDGMVNTIVNDRTGIAITWTDYIKYLGLDTTQTETDVVFSDIDADGDADMVYRHWGQSYIVKNTQGEFGVPIEIIEPESEGSGLFSRHILGVYTKLPATDFNGDGRADIVLTHYEERPRFNRAYYLVAYELNEGSNGSYTYTPIAEIPYSYTTNSLETLYTGDINNDGYTDVMIRNASEYKLSLSTGKNFSDIELNLTIKNNNGWTTNKEDIQSMQFVDVNKDGQVDVLYFNKHDKEWRVHYQESMTFDDDSSLLVEESSFDQNSDSTLVGDWNGDGRLDTARIDYSNLNVYYRHNSDTFIGKVTDQHFGLLKNQPGNYIQTITNGFGLETSIKYDLMTNNALYTKGDNADELDYGNGSPVYDLISPSYLVSEVISDAPDYSTATSTYDTDNKVSVSYKYQGLRAQAGGRGNLGFEKLTSYDKQTNVTTDTVYHQNFPYIGMPKATLSYFGQPQADALNTDGTTSIIATQRIKYATNSYANTALNANKIIYPYLQNSTEHTYSINDAGTATTKIAETLTSNTYQTYSDNHANLQTIVVTSKNAAGTAVSTVTTTNSYTAENVSNWWLGRVSGTTVLHERPSAYPTSQRSISRESSFQYNSDGMLAAETTDLGSSGELTTLHCYDNTWGNEIKTITYANVGSISCSSAHITTENNINKVFRRSVTTYDDDGRYVTSTGNDKFTLSTVNSRNDRGQITQTTDINGVVTKIGYDAFGNQYYTGNSLGQWSKTTRSYSNDSTSHYTESITAAGKAPVVKSYNNRGLVVLTSQVGFDGRSIYQSNYYDAYARAVKQSMPYYQNDTQYYNITYFDAFGRVQSSETAENTTSGTTSTVTYNGLVTTTTVTTNDEHSVSQSQVDTKNVLGNTVSLQDAVGTINYQYNAVGNLTKVTGVDNTVIKTTYDDYGRKIAMSDPNKGDWSYGYNNLGELISQTSANGFTTTFYRDNLGRTVSREVTGNNISDETNYNYSTSHLLQSEDNNLQSKQYFYDNFGRADIIRTTIDNNTYSQQVTYDEIGRVFQNFEADNTSLQGCISNNNVLGECWGIQNHYNSYGYLDKKIEARNGASTDAKVYYEVTAMDALGNVTHFNQSDNLTSSIKGYNQANGFINAIVTESNGVAIQNNDYTFDGLGNLRSRTNNTLKSGAIGQSETFDYDNISRLTHINNVEKVKYAANGNIIWKQDVGYYCYNAARPHAVSGIGSANCTSQSYQYDANGNMTSGRGRTINYSHFDKPVSITNTQGSTTFTYGTDRKRFKRVTTEVVDGASVTTTTYYIGSVEVVSKSNSSVVTTRRNLPGAIELRRSNGTREISYLHTDHLGSIDTISDANGDIKQKLYFDAWGKKQIIDSGNYINILQGSATLSLSQLLDITPRGFTGHESVDHADIIHMNGRIYDPTLGRFLQADPHIQAPKNSQSFNRYAYVLNNPLSLTDPSGYFFSGLKKFVKKYGRVIVAAVAAYYTFGAVSGMLLNSGGMCAISMTVGQGILAGAAAGAVSGAIMTGSLKGTLRGAFAGGVTGGVASSFGNTYSLSRVASDGVANGVVAEMTGGRFKDGLKMGLSVSMITYANVKLREMELRHSKGTPGQVGDSPGFRGLKGKLGGGRIVDKYWAETGQKVLEGGGTLEEAMTAYYAHDKLVVSPLGGHQGGQGIMFSDKLTYSPGGFFDSVVEGFAGTHDSLNHWYHYNSNGTAIYREGGGYYFGEVLNGANVLIAAPIVAPAMIPDYLRYSVYQGIKDSE